MVSVVSLVSVSNAIKTQRHGGTENNNKLFEDTEIKKNSVTQCLCVQIIRKVLKKVGFSLWIRKKGVTLQIKKYRI